MKKNLFEMGAKFEDGWNSNNRTKAHRATKETKEPSKHLLTLAKEKRQGKTVTIIKPFYLKTDSLKSLLKELKKTLGSGGTIKENTLELQGEVSAKAKEFLTRKGFRFK